MNSPSKDSKIHEWLLEGGNKMKSIVLRISIFISLLTFVFSIGDCAFAQDSNGNKPIYYVNFMSDNAFYDFEENLDAYRIYSYEEGDIKRISKNPAYALTTMNDLIYYMKIDGLEREDGFVQRGTIWQVNLNGTNEKEVSSESIFTLTSDGQFIYFVGDKYGDNIMKMRPGKAPEVFLKNTKSFRIHYSNGWLYFMDSKDDSVKRVNLKNKNIETMTRRSTIYYEGFIFGVNNNYLIMPTETVNGSTEIIKVNVNTKKEELFNDFDYKQTLNDDGVEYPKYDFEGIENGILISYNREEDKIEFFNLNKSTYFRSTIKYNYWTRYDNGNLLAYIVSNRTSNEDSGTYALITLRADYTPMEVHIIDYNLGAGESTTGYLYDSSNLDIDSKYIFVKVSNNIEKQQILEGLQCDETYNDYYNSTDYGNEDYQCGGFSDNYYTQEYIQKKILAQKWVVDNFTK